MTTRQWLKGLGATVIASVANAVNGLILLPDVFNFSKAGIENTAKLVAVPTIGAICYYLMKSPLADVTATIDEKGRITEVEGSVDVAVKSTKN